MKANYNKVDTSIWCGFTGEGTFRLILAIQNDEGLYNFVLRNKTRLLSMDKASLINTIKRNTTQSWAKKDNLKVSYTNVNLTQLKNAILDL